MDLLEKANEQERAVLEVIQAESLAYFANDFDALAACWLQTDDAVKILAGPGIGVRKLNGWAQIGESFRESMEWAPQHYDAREYLRRKNVQVSVSGDMAWVYYDQVLAKNDPNFITDPLHYETKVLHRVEGRWRIACMIIVAPEKVPAKTPEIRLAEVGKVVQLNDEAKARIGDFPGLKVVGDRLAACGRDMNEGFQAAIKERVQFLRTMFPPGLINRSAQPIPLGHDDYSRPMYCWMRVVQSEISVTFDDAAAMEGWIAHASELYGLSPSQRRLVELLIRGLDLPHIAEDMGVQVSTIRTQLRRVFDKTGTNSQTALAASVMSVRKPG